MIPRTWRDAWPLLLVLALLAGSVGLVARRTAQATGGANLYVLDDTYIHMAVAKNLALHGVWGLTRYEFSGASSSPLWTLLLAARYRVGGVHDLTPLWLNILAAAALAVFVHGVLLQRGLQPPGLRFLATSAVVLLAPALLLVFCGMEHTLHALLVLALVYYSAVELAESGSLGRRAYAILPALAALAVMARLESLFVVMLIGLLLLARRRWGLAVAVGAAALAPVAVYGLVSTAHGWMWLPSSIQVKSAVLIQGEARHAGLLRSLLRRPVLGYGQTLANPHMYSLLLAGLVALALRLRRPAGFWAMPTVAVALFLGATLLHAQFSIVARYPVSRYEAYLVALGVFALALCLPRPRPDESPRPGLAQRLAWSLAPVIAVLAFAAPLGVRAARQTALIPPAARNIAEQQVQMGRFLQAYWPGATVVANDIGAINYYGDIRCLDIVGLGTLETAHLMMAGEYTVARLDELIRNRHADIAIVYPYWVRDLAGGIPANWRPVGQWSIDKQVVCAGRTVAFYAIAPGSDERLTASLRAFAPRLPPTVTQSGPYTGPPGR